MSEKERQQQKKHRATLGDVFDLLRGRNDFISPKTFTQKHQEMEIDFENLLIRVDKKYTLKLEVAS